MNTVTKETVLAHPACLSGTCIKKMKEGVLVLCCSVALLTMHIGLFPILFLN